MRQKISYIAFIILLITLFNTGCITEYNANVDEISNLLVVEGTITSDTTIIKLSKSVGLSDEINNMTYIDHANVFVECDNGTTYPALLRGGSGEYKIPLPNLDSDKKYRLKIYVDNDEYESDYRTPLMTPVPDSVSLSKEAKGKPVSVHISTHGSGSSSVYYRWSYDEIWEIRSPLWATLYKDENGMIKDYNEATGPFNLGYYCWFYNKSNSLFLGSTGTASENRIVNRKLFEESPEDERFSYLYYIEITQNQLQKDAYDYFLNLQKNVESTGSIFGPVPSEMKGNITCVTNPDIPVIGFIEVSATTRVSRFYDNSYFYEFPIRIECEISTDGSLIDDYYFLPYMMEDKAVSFALATCIDCRRKSGTKNKPDFWPNNHR